MGDGKSINIWQDPWLSLNKQERPMGPPTEQSAELCVADLLIQEGMRWNRRKIQPVLPEYEEQILSLKPSLTGVSDKLIWLSTKSGDYSVKYGYYVAVESDVQIAGADTEFDWSKNVWKLDCAPKVKLFSWKLLKGALPVGERLIERHIEVDPTCKRCGCNESIIHLLFQCQFAQKVWQLAPFVTEMDYRGTVDLLTAWPLICYQKCLPPSGIASGTLFPWIAWDIWNARNRLVFDGLLPHPRKPSPPLSGWLESGIRTVNQRLLARYETDEWNFQHQMERRL